MSYAFRSKTPRGFPGLRKTLATTLTLPPDLCQETKEFSNGLKHRSPTMHMRKRMVQRGDFHGSERRLPWFRATTSMVGLRDFHGSAFEDAWFRFRTSIHCHETTLSTSRRPSPEMRAKYSKNPAAAQTKVQENLNFADFSQ